MADQPAGYGSVYHVHLSNSKVSVTGKAIYAVIAAFSGGSKESWPSQTTIANYLGISRETVNRHIEELVENKVVRLKTSPGSVNRYIPQLPPEEPVTLASQGCDPSVTGGVTPASQIRRTIKKNKKNCVSDEDRKRVIGAYLKLFENKCGIKTNVDPATIGSMGYLIENKGVEEVLLVMERYFANGFYFNKQGYSFRTMYWHYDEILSSIPKVSTKTEWQCPICGEEATGNLNGARYCVSCKTDAVEVEA